MNTTVSILYFSPTDGTAKVVKEIAKGMSDHIKEYDMTLPKNRQGELFFGKEDRLIVGVPVYAGRVPEVLIDYLSKIKGENTPAIFVAVYGNRDYDDALLELKTIFESNGFIGIASGAFIAEHSNTVKVGTNRPDGKDLEIARNFGQEIKDKLEHYKDETQLPKLVVKGNFPYKERPVMPPIVPSTSEACIACGICAKQCPTQAIDYATYKDTDAEKCIHCCSCVKRCPVGAKAIEHEVFQKITNGLIANFSTVRKEPECFI